MILSPVCPPPKGGEIFTKIEERASRNSARSSQAGDGMNHRGFSLIELLVAVIISTIAFFALAMPFIAERSMWGSGNKQAEAQRDAQMVTRAMAHVARESSNYAVGGTPGTNATLTFIRSAGNVCFKGGSAFNSGQLCRLEPSCAAPTTTIILVDGVRSKVTEFTVTQIVANKLVKIRLNVTHQNITNFAGEPIRNELLETQIFLRNG